MSEHNFWQDRNVYVTGGSGLLGGWVISELNARGANVVSLVRDLSKLNKTQLIPNSQPTNTVFGCLEDFETQVRAINEYEIDTSLRLLFPMHFHAGMACARKGHPDNSDTHDVIDRTPIDRSRHL